MGWGWDRGHSEPWSGMLLGSMLTVWACGILPGRSLSQSARVPAQSISGPASGNTRSLRGSVASPPRAAIQLLASLSNSTDLCSSLFQRGVSALLGGAFKIPLPLLSLLDSLQPPPSFSPNSIPFLEKVNLGGGAGVQLTELYSPIRHGGYDTDKILKTQRRNQGSNQGRLPEEGDV